MSWMRMGKKLKSVKPAAEGIHYRKLETIRWKHRSRKKEREKGLLWDNEFAGEGRSQKRKKERER